MEGTGCQGLDKGVGKAGDYKNAWVWFDSWLASRAHCQRDCQQLRDCCLSVRFWETVPLARTTAIGAKLPSTSRQMSVVFGSRMLVPANVGFQDENSTPEGLERVNLFRSASESGRLERVDLCRSLTTQNHSTLHPSMCLMPFLRR